MQLVLHAVLLALSVYEVAAQALPPYECGGLARLPSQSEIEATWGAAAWTPVQNLLDDCDTRGTQCERWACEQNANRLARIIFNFGPGTKGTCDEQQQPPGNPNNCCTIGGNAVHVGSFVLGGVCNATPEEKETLASSVETFFAEQGVTVVIPPKALPIPPPAVVAQTVARQQFFTQLDSQGPALLAANPDLCVINGTRFADNSPQCREQVRATAVVQPGAPSLVNILAQEFINQGVYTTLEWATVAATRVVVDQQPRGIADGDPHLRAFDNTPFTFDGTDNHVYTLFSEENNQINALFTRFSVSNDKTNSSTWATAVGVRYGLTLSVELQIVIEDMLSLKTEQGFDGLWRMLPPTDKPYLKLTVNGEDWSTKIRTDSTELVSVDDDVDVEISLPSQTKEGEDNDGALLIIKTPDVEVTFALETEGVLHLDTQMGIVNPNIGVPGGILGETLFWTIPGTPKKLAGEERDYEVNSLLATECLMCNFAMTSLRNVPKAAVYTDTITQQLQQTTSTARRLFM